MFHTFFWRLGRGGVGLYDCERDTTEHHWPCPSGSKQASSEPWWGPSSRVNQPTTLPFPTLQMRFRGTTLDLNQLPGTSNSWSVTPRAEFLTHSYGIFFTLLSAQYQPHIFLKSNWNHMFTTRSSARITVALSHWTPERNLASSGVGWEQGGLGSHFWRECKTKICRWLNYKCGVIQA